MLWNIVDCLILLKFSAFSVEFVWNKKEASISPSYSFSCGNTCITRFLWRILMISVNTIKKKVIFMGIFYNTAGHMHQPKKIFKYVLTSQINSTCYIFCTFSYKGRANAYYNQFLFNFCVLFLIFFIIKLIDKNFLSNFLIIYTIFVKAFQIFFVNTCTLNKTSVFIKWYLAFQYHQNRL